MQQVRPSVASWVWPPINILLGRNGGHLTPATYKHFHKLQEAYGLEQAVRSLAIENYTVSSLLNIIKSENLMEEVDLTPWGHIDLLLTDMEIRTAHADLETAKAAGVDVSSVEWLSKETMNDVCIGIYIMSIH